MKILKDCKNYVAKRIAQLKQKGREDFDPDVTEARNLLREIEESIKVVDKVLEKEKKDASDSKQGGDGFVSEVQEPAVRDSSSSPPSAKPGKKRASKKRSKGNPSES